MASSRTVQDTFTHLPDRLRGYEELSGRRIDVERVWYYRVFAEATMVARVVKYLQQVDIAGRQYAELELAEIGELLGTDPATLAVGRSALAAALAQGEVNDTDYIEFIWKEIHRDDELARTASGSMHGRPWPALV